MVSIGALRFFGAPVIEATLTKNMAAGKPIPCMPRIDAMDSLAWPIDTNHAAHYVKTRRPCRHLPNE
jgi:hypothetical protein